MTAPRILLGQLYSNGDCLFATVVARQIKQDYPGCHLTWAVSQGCRAVLQGNPHVDAVWEVAPPAPPGPDQHARMWRQFAQEADGRARRGEYDRVFLTQIRLATLHRYDGTVRSTIYRAYPGPITVPGSPVLRLETEEVENARRFVAAHPAMTRCRHVALFECAPKSGQSAVNPEFALALSRRLTAEFEDLCIVLSSNLRIDSGDPRIVDASGLTFRENAELTRACTLLVGCSSGLTWLSTSDGARRLPTVQMISRRTHFPNSLAVDQERQGQPTDGIIELVDADLARAGACLAAVFRDGFPAARVRFHQRLALTESYAYVGRSLLILGRRGQFLAYVWSILRQERFRPALLVRLGRVVAGRLLRRRDPEPPCPQPV